MFDTHFIFDHTEVFNKSILWFIKYYIDYLLYMQPRPKVIGRTAEIKTTLYFDARRSRKFGRKSWNLL